MGISVTDLETKCEFMRLLSFHGHAARVFIWVFYPEYPDSFLMLPSQHIRTFSTLTSLTSLSENLSEVDNSALRSENVKVKIFETEYLGLNVFTLKFV